MGFEILEIKKDHVRCSINCIEYVFTKKVLEILVNVGVTEVLRMIKDQENSK